MKGALHIHSTFSDGEFSLEELRRTYVALGYRFACVTDHAEYFDESSRAAYVAEAARLSDETFLFVPGLEYECPERMHILALGTTSLLRTRDPQDVIRAIEAEGGISVMAHPRTQDFGRIQQLAEPPTGIEAWNSKYDGRYAPRTATFALVRGIRERHPRVRAFFGQDLHFRNQYTGLHVDLSIETLDAAAILRALRDGRFVARSAELCLMADGSLDASTANQFELWHRRSSRMRRLAKSAKAVLDSLGVAIPAGLKTQIRRLF